ncbi:stage III sporulation protein AC [Anaerotignum lactatifermentans]|uniref:Stage III sporulation protein AC n=1 Tax=Anaerotignum lactatifermentans TaxID=160404 RepID=A0ABS2G5N7_9FIRM|nr:stage III sporulation protein AC [Anaerotignum lactatifermentans]MBM6828086.1 stage III sporulation protein AC [Anaerotignum lactatifermentans]MBM6876751.1 stage III sporulation protein AC [Anaerotignum lactatifermentans]MBM6949669.1 stage III sporulation protein AC [Anaerotignum lactatifermentans]
MEIGILFRIAAVGILVAVLNQILLRAGREETAMMTTLAGLVLVLFWVIEYIGTLFETIRTLFQL